MLFTFRGSTRWIAAVFCIFWATPNVFAGSARGVHPTHRAHPSHRPASPDAVEEFDCGFRDRWPAIQLGSSPRCRISIARASSEKICLSEALWDRFEKSEKTDAICGRLVGRWRYFSPPAIETGSKPVFRAFELTDLPRTPSQQRIFPLWIKLQSLRLRISNELRRHDPWGVFRALLLGERNSESPLGFLRFLGLESWISSTGIHLYLSALIFSAMIIRFCAIAQISARAALGTSRLAVCAYWLWAWLLAGCRLGMLRPILVFCARLLSRTFGFKWRKPAPLILSFAVEIAASNLLGKSMDHRILVTGAIVGFFFLLGPFGGWIAMTYWRILSFEGVSFAAPLCGFLLLPFFCALAYPALFLGSLFPELLSRFSWLFDSLHEGLNLLVSLCLRFPTLWLLPKGALYSSLAFTFALATFLKSQGPIPRRNAIALSLCVCAFFRYAAPPLLSPRVTAPIRDALAEKVIQLDVGQGDATLVLSAGNQAGMIDAGSAFALDDAAWLKVFSRWQVSKIDWIALTHLDEDHRGGVERISRLIPIRCVASSREELESPRGIAFSKELASRKISVFAWDSEHRCVPFPVHAPKIASVRSVPRKQNGNANMSAILVPLRSGQIYLSPGDAEGQSEIEIARWASRLADRIAPQSERILKVAHHGSKTSSAPETLRIFHPKIAVISVGLGNSYGHPSREILERYARARIPIRRTDREGPLQIEALKPSLEKKPSAIDDQNVTRDPGRILTE